MKKSELEILDELYISISCIYDFILNGVPRDGYNINQCGNIATGKGWLESAKDKIKKLKNDQKANR